MLDARARLVAQLMTVKSVLMDQSDKILRSLRVAAFPEQTRWTVTAS